MPSEEKKLQFLTSLLAVKKVTMADLARQMGVSPQNVQNYFRRDDMKLSYALKFAEALGFDLKFSFERDGKTSETVRLDVQSILNSLNGTVALSRLSFLTIAMKLYGIERKDLAEKLGIAYVGVNKWFKVDDIAISYLFEIAELYGLKVCIKADRILSEVEKTTTLVLA